MTVPSSLRYLRFSTALLLATLLAVFLGGCAEEPLAPAVDDGPRLGGSLAKDATVARSFEEFIAAQGTYCLPDGAGGCFLYNDPVPNYLAFFDPSNAHAVKADWAGIEGQWIYDETGGAIDVRPHLDGTVTERVLPDGRALVRAHVHMRHGMIIGSDFNIGFTPEATLFGATAQQVAAGDLEPALGKANFLVEFVISEPGAPLPDLMELAFGPGPDEELRSLTFNCYAAGELRELYGVPDGTPGSCSATQTALFTVPSSAPGWNAFPVEQVRIKAKGGVRLHY